jgi:hypothetical protein
VPAHRLAHQRHRSAAGQLLDDGDHVADVRPAGQLPGTAGGEAMTALIDGDDAMA